MPIVDVMRRLSEYKDKPILVYAGYYDFCMQEEHPHHGHKPSDNPRYQARIPLTLKGFKQPTGRWQYLDTPPHASAGQPDVSVGEPLGPEQVAVYGTNPSGDELTIPFNARADEVCGFSHKIILRITANGDVLFEPQITVDPTKDLFEYRV